MQVPEDQKNYDKNMINFKIEDYKLRNNTRYALNALKELVKTPNLKKDQKSIIYERLKKHKLQNAIENSYSYKYYMLYLDILSYLYPEKTLADLSLITNSIWEKYNYVEYWNRPKYNVDEFNEYLIDFKKLNFDTNKISELAKLNYKKEYRERNDFLVIVGLFNLFDNSLWYDCETGIIPNDYSSLISEYLVLAKTKLHDFHPICSVSKSDNKLIYNSSISNHLIGYKVSPRDFGDWYDPITIEAMLNQALKDQETDKRFIQVSTGGQAILSIYIEPYKLTYLSSKYNFTVLN